MFPFFPLRLSITNNNEQLFRSFIRWTNITNSMCVLHNISYYSVEDEHIKYNNDLSTALLFGYQRVCKTGLPLYARAHTYMSRPTPTHARSQVLPTPKSDSERNYYTTATI